jgi:dimethylaniline monooxygenase (N-oxide forming)
MLGRLYEDFWTQWIIGAAEYSDTPMPVPPAEDTYFDTFRARYTTQYLEDYVDHQIFASQSLRDRINFGFEVQDIKKVDGQWVISGKDNANEAKTYHASKLIVASGVLSIPNLPKLPNKERFEAPIIHLGDFGQSSVLSSPNTHHVTVLGGSKSSADMIYACVKANKSVSWIIRVPGTGPGFFLAAKGIGPYKNAISIGSTRVAATLSPSFFVDNWWTRFLHTTSWGVKFVTGFWKGVSEDINKVADFGRPGTKGFEKLKPHTP